MGMVALKMQGAEFQRVNEYDEFLGFLITFIKVTWVTH